MTVRIIGKACKNSNSPMIRSLLFVNNELDGELIIQHAIVS